MRRFINYATLTVFIITALMTAICMLANKQIFETLAITCGTVFYHFAIRLLIGNFYQLQFNNKLDYQHRRFRVSQAEIKLYQAIKVKRWKKHLPTYNSILFDMKQGNYKELAMAMCQAELVHETIIAFSFLPIMAAIWLGGIEVFIATSIIAAFIDLAFVIVQRYNRARVMRILAGGLPHTNQNRSLAK